MLGVGRAGACGRAEAPPAGATVADTFGWPGAAGDLDARERDAWVVLDSVQGVGPVSFARLIGAFGDARAVLRAATGPRGPSLLVAASAGPEGGSPSLSLAIAGAIAAAAREPDRCLDPLCESGVRALTLADADYPARLRRIDLPPPVLYVAGSAEALDRAHAVAIVGTRRPTAVGRATSGRIADAIAGLGATVVSGLALGHRRGRPRGRAACRRDHRRGHRRRPRAPVSGGQPGARPRDRRDGGAVISEFPPETMPTRGTFPRRNRIISGLADATVVVEAGARSGALTTAAWALEQGRGLYIVPGRLDDPAVAGCLAFLREAGPEARIVPGVAELIEDLGLVGDGGRHRQARVTAIAGRATPASRRSRRRADGVHRAARGSRVGGRAGRGDGAGGRDGARVADGARAARARGRDVRSVPGGGLAGGIGRRSGNAAPARRASAHGCPPRRIGGARDRREVAIGGPRCYPPRNPATRPPVPARLPIPSRRGSVGRHEREVEARRRCIAEGRRDRARRARARRHLPGDPSGAWRPPPDPRRTGRRRGHRRRHRGEPAARADRRRSGAAPAPVTAQVLDAVRTGHTVTAPIQVGFDTPMDAASVAGALRIVPDSAVSVSWDPAGKQLTIAPTAHWQPDTLYTVTIDTSARSEAGGRLATAVRALVLTAPAGRATITATRPLGSRPHRHRLHDQARPPRHAGRGPRGPAHRAHGHGRARAGATAVSTGSRRERPRTRDELSRMAEGLVDGDGVPFEAWRRRGLDRRVAVRRPLPPARRDVAVDRAAMLSVRFTQSMDRKRPPRRSR